jgi:membrane protein implicated in regulation of membrane protease activity
MTQEKGVPMVVLAWLMLGVVLLAVEMHHLQFYALFGAAGAVAAALVAALAPSAYPAQVAVAVTVAVIGGVAVRPMMSEAMHRRRGGRLGRGMHGTLIGEEVLTLDAVGDSFHGGHVRLVGERWLAISGSGSPIPPGTRVLVTAVEGTTLTVWPVDGGTYPIVDGINSNVEPPERAEGEQA